MATTACPHCDAQTAIPDGDHGRCEACGRPLRFIEVPDTTCGCGQRVVFRPGTTALQCSCGAWHGVDGRDVRFVAQCPRCKRDVDVDAASDAVRCTHCDTPLRLDGTV